MCFITIEDISASIECIVFSRLYADRVTHLQAGNVIVINGRLSLREEKEATVICETIEPNPYNILKDELKQKKQRKGIFLRFESADSQQKVKVQQFFENHEGDRDLYFYYIDSKMYEKRNPVCCDIEIINKLKELLGDENVVIRE